MNFIKTFFASLLAVVVGFGAVIFFWTMIIFGIVAAIGSPTPAFVSSDSVLQLNMGTVTDAPAASPFEDFDFMAMKATPRTTLLKAIQSIQAAADDSRIKGIYINFDETTNVSLATLEELRAELVKFKESGKFIVAYQENWSQIALWFASVADKIYTNPAGEIQWTGLSSQVMFYKGLLDKLDIEPVVVRHGSFKSAVEPFILDKMSPENRQQFEKLTGSIWNMIVNDIATARQISHNDLLSWADNLTIDSPQTATSLNLIDGSLYEDQVLAEMANLVNTTDSLSTSDALAITTPPNIVSFSDYASQVTATNPSAKDKIAIIYAEGSIVSGSGDEDEIGSASIVKQIQQARDDESTAAVLLRINSPGGSALASEVIWRELELLKTKKPLIVSMGALAASGGYYIAAPADAIFANQSTLTGSIGVFGLYFNAGTAFNKHLGITVDVASTNKHSDIGSPFRSPSPDERAFLQNYVESVYSTFIQHVADGRNIPTQSVDNIGQGRIWSGADALPIGLIDSHGGLSNAISLAAERANISQNFKLWEIPNPNSPFSYLFSSISTSISSSLTKHPLSPQITQIQHILQQSGPQTQMPYSIEIR